MRKNDLRKRCYFDRKECVCKDFEEEGELAGEWGIVHTEDIQEADV